MPEIAVNIEVYCDTCGAGLCNQTTFVTTRHRNEPAFRVEVCTHCIEQKNNEISDLNYEIDQLKKQLSEVSNAD